MHSEYDPARWEGAGVKTRKKKKGSKETELDKYALLGLSNERYLATEAMIKDGRGLVTIPSHKLAPSRDLSIARKQMVRGIGSWIIIPITVSGPA